MHAASVCDAADSSTPGRTLMSMMVSDVNEAVESTRNMVAKAGRASYVGHDKTRGHLDAGAMAVLVIFKAILQIL